MLPKVDHSNPMMRDIGLIKDRHPGGTCAELPNGTVVVSADTHYALRDDIWIERFPPHLKDRAPRVWHDERHGLYQIGIAGKPIFSEAFFPILKSTEDRAGASEMVARLSDMDAEGVAKEIAFPQSVQGFFRYPDFEVREWIFRSYNEHLAEVAAKAPGRFYGVGIADVWNPVTRSETVEHIRALGLKTFMIPTNPGKDVNGKPINYADADFSSFWSAVENSGLPVCFHVGESVNIDGPGRFASVALDHLGPFRKSLGELIFGGIFDRHPRLKIVFAEANINWVPGALQDAEMLYDSFGSLLQPKIDHRPSHYWNTHCFATFMLDPIGMRLLDQIGAERVMWSSDYPHNEGTFGYIAGSINAVLSSVSEHEARQILGGTATELFALET